jgi:hypothetical protein
MLNEATRADTPLRNIVPPPLVAFPLPSVLNLTTVVAAHFRISFY